MNSKISIICMLKVVTKIIMRIIMQVKKKPFMPDAHSDCKF